MFIIFIIRKFKKVDVNISIRKAEWSGRGVDPKCRQWQGGCSSKRFVKINKTGLRMSMRQESKHRFQQRQGNPTQENYPEIQDNRAQGRTLSIWRWHHKDWTQLRLTYTGAHHTHTHTQAGREIKHKWDTLSNQGKQETKLDKHQNYQIRRKSTDNTQEFKHPNKK